MSDLSLRETAEHTTFTCSEAVAVAQAIIANSKAAAHEGTDAPTLATITIAPDGSLSCDASTSSPDSACVGQVLNALLAAGSGQRVPGALRYTIARAMNDVDAPPFDTLDALAAALARHETGDRAAVIQQLYARTTSASSPEEHAARIERRKHGEHAAALRRELRLADEAMYLLEHRAAAVPDPAVELPHRAPVPFGEIDASLLDLPLQADSSAAVDAPGFRARNWVVGGMLAVLLAFAAGYAAVPLAHRAHQAPPSPPPEHTITVPAPQKT